jgi:hypothetical protein
MRSFSRDMLKALSEDSAYEGAVQQDCEASFSGAADRQPASIFKRICLGDLRLHEQTGYG